MKPKILLFLSLLVILFIFVFVVSKINISNKNIKDTRINISTTFYPLYDFAQKVGGNKVLVTNLTPAGTEPHDYEPTPKDLANLYNTNLFIYNGINLEGWVDKIIPDLESKNITIVKASEGVLSSNQDPHIWIDPVIAQRIVLNIKDKLVEIDPINTDYYNQNSDDVIQKLIDLDREYQKSLQNCKQSETISSHNVLGYLSSRYKFTNLSVTGLTPNEEAPSKDMANISDLIKSKNIKYILTEPLISADVINTVSQETGAQVLTFNPIEGLTKKELDQGADYFSVQKQNIINLSKSLECQNI